MECLVFENIITGGVDIIMFLVNIANHLVV